MNRTLLFDEITEATLLPKIVRLGPTFYGAVFTLMKLVPARYILRRALDRGELEPGTVIVETTSGTFGLALAMEAALLKRELVLVSDPVIDAQLHRRLTDLGATVDIVEHPAREGGYQAARLARLAELRKRLPSSFCPEQYANPDNPASYSLVAEHLRETIGQVDCVVGPVGSGGSLCGTVRALRSHTPHTRAIGVDTHRSVLFGQTDGPRLLRGLGNSLLPANLDHRVLDEVHWCPPAEAFTTTRWAHRRHALFQGPTSGAALLAARWWAETNPDASCVVMLPDEGYRYLDTVYDDAWIAEQGVDLTAPTPDKPTEVSHPARMGESWSYYPWQRRSLETVLAEADR
ncbi:MULTISPECIES: pyridoxal-phosphate dependent enzyme [Streptomyces]|uniref:pyridoxal-phosphate dependent enzyme n=1 Tax=Streptomyces TaxID=1883 RepID=UPI00368B5F15